MIDRADDLCDMARQAIEAAAAALPIAGTAIEVECVDDVDIDISDMPPHRMRVIVSWERFEDGGPVARGEQATDYLILILAVEVCEHAGKVPLEWRRKRTNWFTKCVLDTVGDARQKIDGAYSLRQDMVAVSVEELTERKAFWCGTGITLRDIQRKGR